MFLFHSFHPKSLRRTLVRSVSTLCILSCLIAVLLFAGCNSEDDGDFVDDHKLNTALIGTWEDTANYDGYAIADTKIEYFGFAEYSGTIQYVLNFTSAKDAGVIIIEYDTENKPTYYTNEHWNDPDPDHYLTCTDPDHIMPLKGNFIGIYYKAFKPGVSVEMAGASLTGGAEEATLEAAKAAFTAGKEGTYIPWGYGTYTRAD